MKDKSNDTPPPQTQMMGIKAAQITMGRGLVDVTTITHEGRSGILFRTRDHHIPVGEPGELLGGAYWPVEGDVVIWIENEAGASVIDNHLQAFMPAAPDEQMVVAKTPEDLAQILDIPVETFSDPDLAAKLSTAPHLEESNWRKECVLLLSVIDYMSEATGEFPDEPDAVLIAEIRAALSAEVEG